MDLLSSIVAKGAEVAAYTYDMRDVFLQIVVAALVAYIVLYMCFWSMRRGKGKTSMTKEERRIFVEDHLKSAVLYAVREEQRRGKITKIEADYWVNRWELLKDPEKRSLKEITNTVVRKLSSI